MTNYDSVTKIGAELVDRSNVIIRRQNSMDASKTPLVSRCYLCDGYVLERVSTQ